MRATRIIGFGGAVVAALALVSVGAGTATTRGAALDTSTKAAVVQYLRSIHVDPKGVVIQRGARNYAGPHCPGSRWTCASTAHAVVQVAAPGGQNAFRCSSASCAVVQVAAAVPVTNTASCIRTTGITQACSISQTSTGTNMNTAIVVEVAKKMAGLTQNTSQTAQIVQTAASGTNTACVYQETTIDGSTVGSKGSPVNVALDAHQTASIAQDSSSGANAVQNASTAGACAGGALTQSQTLTSNAYGSIGITQSENATASGPNMLVDIEQNKNTPNASGTNTSNFVQTSSLTAVASTTPTGSTTQTQSSPGGGLQGTVNQFSHGLSTSSAVQTESQCEHAQTGTITGCNTPNPPSYPFTQTQYGPLRCCSSQGDNLGDSFTINQSVTQNNDNGQNQTNNMQATCTTTGNCTARQNTNIDGTPSTNFQSGQTVNATTNCTGSTCTTTGGQTGGQLSVPNTDVAEFGYGGMRGDGTGLMTVSGVTGTVTKALLYWNGPTNSSDPNANASVTFKGTPVTGTNIGFASSNCWDYAPSQPYPNSQSYRADVTSLVSGNGTYSLSNFRKSVNVEINGVSLIVFYNDGNASNDRNVVLWNGNDSNVVSPYDAAGWDETLTGVPYPGSGSASLDFVVSDGQAYLDDALTLNNSTLAPAGAVFQGSTPGGSFDAGGNASGSLWDVKSFDITTFLSAGSNTLHLTTGQNQDCISLVVLIANVPASGPPVIGSPAGGPRQHVSSARFRVAPVRSRPRGSARPSARRAQMLAGTASRPLRAAQSGGVLGRTPGGLRQDR